MSLAIVYSRANIALAAPLVTIEVHLSKGLPGLSIVGLPEKAVKESKDRVRSALINNGFEFPVRRIVINLAPADLPKEGGRFDLPIALGILAASDQIPKENLLDTEFVGELALTGALKSVKGVLPMALAAKSAEHQLIIPKENEHEAALVNKLNSYSADHISTVCAHIRGTQKLEQITIESQTNKRKKYPDLSDIKSQQQAKRALEIAAAGAHSILFSGPPGTGKTMLSSRLPSILADMSEKEAQSTAAVYSISQQGFHSTDWKIRPFRALHHTASSVALVGGGSPPQPGEISLAHNGVLFLDELPEFNRHVLEALREPLEAGFVTISRAAHQAKFPSRFQFIAAMNPCPCGYHGDVSARCRCSAEQVSRYQNRLSGPLLDRIDMHVSVQPIPAHLLFRRSDIIEENSDTVKKRVLAARKKQIERAGYTNNLLSGKELTEHCSIQKNDLVFLENAVNKLGLSARAYSRILRLSRTIADLDNADTIQLNHLQEALTYRKK